MEPGLTTAGGGGDSARGGGDAMAGGGGRRSAVEMQPYGKNALVALQLLSCEKL